jgi:gliding motility-associated-like protein
MSACSSEGKDNNRKAMKKHNKIVLFALFFLMTFIAFSCKKQDTPTPEPIYDTLLVNAPGMFYDMSENTILTLDATIPEATSYLWLPGNLSTPTITIRDEGYYEVTIITPSQQYDYQVTVVYNGSDCYIPNSFTPNNDMLNDTWRPYFYNISTENYYLYVYNADNVKLFTTEDPLQAWDGKYHGQLMPAGYYYYVINYQTISGDSKTKNGMLQLVL